MTDGYKTLCELARDMEPDALRVLVALAKRLAMGRKQYGDLCIATDTRNWRKEASAEALDGCIYLAVDLLKEEP